MTGRTEMGIGGLERPGSVPPEGFIPAFDAGWNAHEVGLGRETVRVLSPTHFAREWALLAWDVRQKLSEKERRTPTGSPHVEACRCSECKQERRECTGSRYCRADHHIHGCFADYGHCDRPAEHEQRIPSGDGGPR